MQQERRFPLNPLGLALALMLATGGAQAHQAGDVILRFGATGTHFRGDKPYGHLGFSDFTGWGNDADFNLKLKDDIAPSLGGTWMFADAFGLNVSGNTYRHNLRARYHGGADPDSMRFDGINMMRFKQHSLDIGGVWYPLGAGSARIHPYVGLATTYARTKSRVHRDWAQLEYDFIDEDVRNGLITAAAADLERQLWDEEMADARVNESEWGWKTHLGADVSLNEHWLLNVQVGYTHAASHITYWNWTIGAGFKF